MRIPLFQSFSHPWSNNTTSPALTNWKRCQWQQLIARCAHSEALLLRQVKTNTTAWMCADLQNVLFLCFLYEPMIVYYIKLICIYQELLKCLLWTLERLVALSSPVPDVWDRLCWLQRGTLSNDHSRLANTSQESKRWEERERRQNTEDFKHQTGCFCFKGSGAFQTSAKSLSHCEENSSRLAVDYKTQMEHLKKNSWVSKELLVYLFFPVKSSCHCAVLCLLVWGTFHFQSLPFCLFVHNTNTGVPTNVKPQRLLGPFPMGLNSNAWRWYYVLGFCSVRVAVSFQPHFYVRGEVSTVKTAGYI